MTRGASCPSGLELDQLFVGELDAARAERSRAHAASCARCAAQVAERERGAAAFAHEVGIDHVTAATLRRLRTVRTTRAVMLAAGAVAIAVAVYLVLPGRAQPGPAEPPDVVAARPGALETPGVRVKGGLALELVAKRLDGRTEWLSSPAVLAPAEAIRFAVSTQAPGFVAIVSVDAASTVSPYVPATMGPAIRIGAGHQQLLDGSIVLDDTLGAERIFAVLCDDPIEVAEVVASARAALQRAGKPARIDLLPLPATCGQTSVLIEKQARRRGAP